MNTTGTLYLVATPIGNLEDITLRAVRILREVDLIAAEDTRQTLKLLNHFEIKKPMASYYEHNKQEKGINLINQLLEGKNIALVSDAGSPGISDPGEDLVKLAIEHGIAVTMAPGPAAVVMGLVLSGFPAGRFAFEGFLSVNKRSRAARLNSLKEETRTMVFYEAPHKLLQTLKDMYAVLGDRRIALARELTKKFEEIIRCTLEDAISKYEGESPRGEYVLVVEGINEASAAETVRRKWNEMTLKEHLELHMQTGMDKKQAMKKVAEDRGLSKRDIYNALLDD
ncbi:MAG: 16S rRNA (cytidine(1402)-2'-O)-methyltransferase [Clostridiales bacterium GWC2_40_7]|nr:MAG: 16S rRNA (cytidine(1402)-2'-O)-methyltransferase [Clostridiales bacterium GWC2_40_7]